MATRTRVRKTRSAIPSVRLLAAAFVATLAATAAIAQDPPALPTFEDLAKDNKLFLAVATKAFAWEEPVDPVRIAGPLYFVGTKGLGSYLIVTKEGNILHNTGMPSSGPMIIESIKKLGFEPKDLKLIINGHAHSDHAGGFAYIKEQTGAEVAIMREDVQAITDGGKDDFHYGHDWEVMGFPPCKVDRILRDGDTIRMGDVVLTAHHTPGHTRGSTTWVANIVHEGNALVVVWPDGAGFNPGYRVAKDPSYPGINADYRRTLHFLESLKPDIFVAAHCEYFGFLDKAKRTAAEGVKAWINPEEYRQWVAGKRRAFEDQVELESGVVTTAAKAAKATETAVANDPLTGTSWRLVKIVSGDGETLEPDQKEKYTLAFQNDGQAALRVDCNRGGGKWESPEPGKLQFGPFHVTRAMCPAGSLHDRVLKDLPLVRSFRLKDGHLLLSLMADGGTYEYAPANEP